MANLKNVIYLSAEDYNTLYTNGTVTINGVTLTYDANNIYIVPDNTQQQIDDILTKIPSNASSSNKMLTADDISSWAKASTKPSYDYSEIGNTPTILDEISIINDEYDANLNISDENNNIIAQFKDGHFRVKNFNSKDTIYFNIIKNI